MSGPQITAKLTAIFERWEPSFDLLEIWRKAMSQFDDVPDGVVEEVLGEHLYERGALPEPVLKTVSDKLDAARPKESRPQPKHIDISDDQAYQRRRQQQFGSVEARRRAEEQTLRSLEPQEFESLRLRAIEFLRKKAPGYLDYTILKNGDSPYGNATIFNAMLAEMGAVKA